jgi:hypothetical protein
VHIRRCKLIGKGAKAQLQRDSALVRNAFSSASPLASEHGNDAEASAFSLALNQLSKPEQECFESDLCKLFVPNRFAWHAVNQLQTQIFFQNWLPDAKLPDCNKLSGSVLQNKVQAANMSMRQAIQGQLATGMSDGWENIKRNLLLASMLLVDYKVDTQFSTRHVCLILIPCLRLTLSGFMIYQLSSKQLKIIST